MAVVNPRTRQSSERSRNTASSGVEVLEPVQRGIQRSLLHLDDVSRERSLEPGARSLL
jgi:hypothetical protein